MRLWYYFHYIVLRILFRLAFRLERYGEAQVPLTGPVLFISNHQSYLDPILCGISIHRELDYIARESLFKNRYFGWLIRSVNAFPIQRDQADIAAIRSIITRLEAGRAIVLYPEGTRSSDGSIRTIKSGFDLIARKAKPTVVPVIIDGAFEAWPRTQKLPSPKKIRVCFGTPWTPEEVKQLGREAFVTQVNQRLREMQNEFRSRFGKLPFDYEALTAEDGPNADGK